ncbi:MAG TPA: CopG family transcriptional regulator [Gemmatimonadota bacterium]|nr:CopG family transcriptional regulator [Gemmatimonadota bacterium]
MARTTLKLDEDLLRRLKEKAAREGSTLQSVANDLLRQALAAPAGREYRLQLFTWKGELQPGVDLNDRDALFDLMEGR